jgi:hypothetical protein
MRCCELRLAAAIVPGSVAAGRNGSVGRKGQFFVRTRLQLLSHRIIEQRFQSGAIAELGRHNGCHARRSSEPRIAQATGEGVPLLQRRLAIKNLALFPRSLSRSKWTGQHLFRRLG